MRCMRCQRSPPLAAPSTVGIGFRGLQEAGGPPRGQERFTSSSLTPSLTLCLLKAWDPLSPSQPSTLAILGRPWAQPAVWTQGSGSAHEQKSKLAPLPRVHPHVHRPDPGCHGAKESK